MNPLYEQMKTSVFEFMSSLAATHGAVNLGQGFPDFGWPDEILDEAARALKHGSNQYAPSRGTSALREAVAAHYHRHFGKELAAANGCVASGATEALGAAILAAVQPGDEVIIFAPAYDSYAPMIRRAGGTPVEVTLQPPTWRVERERLEAEVTPKTRAILFNNPHNPTGRLFDFDELEAIAAVARTHDLIVISDEVWEHIVLAGRRFTPLATLPGMAERTIPDLRDSAELASGGCVRARRGRCLDRADACAVPAGARPNDAGASRRRFCGARRNIDLFPVCRPPGVGVYDR